MRTINLSWQTVLLLTGIGVAVLLTVGILSYARNGPGERTAEPVRLVKTFIVKTPSGMMRRSFPGYVEAFKEVTLAFREAGQLVDLPIVEGQEVKAGEVLARLDQDAWTARMAKVKANFEDAKLDLQRYEHLIATNAVSQSEFDKKKVQYDSAKADLDEAKERLENTVLTAPFDGVVAKKYVENHQFVNSKQEIVAIQDASTIEIRLNIPEHLMVMGKKIDLNSLTARFDAVPHREFEVKPNERAMKADKATQSFSVTVVMPAPEDLTVLPGMAATVTGEFRIENHEESDRCTVPIEAVFADTKNEAFVWVVDQAEMRAHKKRIEIGPPTDDGIAILKGLEGGEMIITAGVKQVQENMKVRPLTSERGSH
jgi:RND family efflux transporter MFP subunit